jgi:non-heme chloroperoxidase
MPRANINGFELFYDQAGSGAPVLFHHGYTGSHDAWEEIVPIVAKQYRCIWMDGRGAGDSAHPETGHSIEQSPPTSSAWPTTWDSTASPTSVTAWAA